MVSIAVCDDELLDCCNIAKDIRMFMEQTGITYIVRQFNSGNDLLHSVESFDIIFLDILMCGMDGMKTARYLRDKAYCKIIIFISSSREYVFEAYDVEAFHYLVKPVDNYKLKSVLWRALKKTGHNSREYIIINKERQGRKLLLRDIFYFEINGRIIYVHTEKGILDYYGKIGDLEKELHDRGFFRCHKGFLVNLDHVGSYNRHEVILDNGERIVIAKRRYNEFCREILIWMKKMEGRYES